MLKVGDLVVHETAGVCRVEGNTRLDGLPGSYYVLCPLYLKAATFYTPVEGGKVKLRPVMSRKDALALIDAIPTIEPVVFHGMNEQKQKSTQILKSGDSYQLVSLTKTIYADQKRRSKVGKKIGSNNAAVLKKAETLLFGELATALELPYEEVPTFVHNHLHEQ